MIYNIGGHILLEVLRNHSKEFLEDYRKELKPGNAVIPYLDRVIDEKVT